MFPGPLGQSLAGDALARGAWSLEASTSATTASAATARSTTRRRAGDRAWGAGKSAGGGPRRRRAARRSAPAANHEPARKTVRAKRRAGGWAAGPGLVIVCPRFEGVDERVIEGRGLIEVSIGDYVLSGGEIAALAVLDACVRLLPGVMGKEESGAEESFQGGPARISPIYPPARLGGFCDPGRAAVGRPRQDRGLAAGRGGADHPRAAAGPSSEPWRKFRELSPTAMDPLRASGKRERFRGSHAALGAQVN